MKAKSLFLIIFILGTIIFCKDTTGNLITPQMICDRKCSDDVQCLKDCLEKPSKIQYGHQEAGANVTLLCRDVNSIKLAFNPGIFVVEGRQSQDGDWSNQIEVDGRSLTLPGLQPDTQYQFRFYRVSEEGRSKPETTGWFETMSNTYKPSEVLRISVRKRLINAYIPKELSVIMSFFPAEDRIVYRVSLRDATPNSPEEFIQGVEGEVFVVFTNLTIETTYTVSIRARTESGMESEKAISYVITPTCADGPRVANKIICAPDQVEGLNATTTRKGENIFDVNVTWAMPKSIPYQYHIWINPRLEDNQHVIHQDTFGTSTELIFPDVEIVNEFRVYIRAEALLGLGPETFKDFKVLEMITGATESGNFIPKYLISTILGVIGIGIGIGIAVYGYSRLRKRRLSQVDDYEVSLKRLLITRVLGIGAFGIVKLGTLQDNQGNLTTVAVKMLRDDSTENDLRSFLNEIKMMKALDEHPNIVSLLGCCTIGPKPFLVVEYCSRGDLHSFLRKSLVEARSPVNAANQSIVICHRLPQSKKIPKKNCDMSSMPTTDDDHVDVSSSAEDQDINCDPVIVTILDMLNFGHQIATGMNFLSSNRIVHRDLATRNVLVCCDRTVKISDFGLSRDIYQENMYKKSGNGRVPIKWMAIEALTHQVYSTHSDVWSFGILLWEIVTLGGNPYPGVPTLDLLKQLQSGYRMKRPENCSIPLYDLMLSCWQTRPRDRPTFNTLRQELGRIISVNTDNEYSDLNKVSEGRPILQ